MNYILLTLLSLLLFLIAVYYEFGTVFLLVTLPCLMFYNTRSNDEIEENEISAYSHFNRDGYTIPGTVTASEMTSSFVSSGIHSLVIFISSSFVTGGIH